MSFLIVISFIDIEHFIIPNKLVYPGIFIGLFFAIYRWILEDDIKLLFSRVLGTFGGAIMILLIAIVGRAVFHKEAMGIGDVKLMAMIGMYIGLWPYIPLILIIGAFIGSMFGLILIILRRKKMDSYIPFGPFLSIGAVISLLYGKEIWTWYKLLVGL
ncbi:MAG: prepilin peptidase [bacterium]